MNIYPEFEVVRSDSRCMGYNYNGRLRSAELLLCEDGSVKMIRRAETPADYFATFDFCGIMDKYRK